jgi:tRNA G46 methylase TrmB
LDVEIGCGNGEHALTYARRHPERTVVAIEKTRARFAQFERQLRYEGVPLNLIPLHTNAVWWITHRLGVSSVDRYFLLFPNPHPKPRQQNRRWHAMPFMARLIETLKPEGTITLATNLSAYAREARQFFEGIWGLVCVHAETRDPATATPRSSFERKYLARGNYTFELVFGKGITPGATDQGFLPSPP